MRALNLNRLSHRQLFLRNKRFLFKVFSVFYLLGVLDVVFKFFPEVAYRAGYRPGGGVT